MPANFKTNVTIDDLLLIFPQIIDTQSFLLRILRTIFFDFAQKIDAFEGCRLVYMKQSIFSIKELLVVTLNVVKFHLFYYAQPLLKQPHQPTMIFVPLSCQLDLFSDLLLEFAERNIQWYIEIKRIVRPRLTDEVQAVEDSFRKTQSIGHSAPEG